MNIDFTDELDYESRPHRNMWQGVLLQAWDDVIKFDEDPRIRYDALSWFFDDEHKQNREDVADLASWNIKSWQDRLTRTIMHRYMPDHITDGPQYDEPFEEAETENQTHLREVMEDIALTQAIDSLRELWENEKDD